MFEKIQNPTDDRSNETADETPAYNAPELRSAGSAISLVQGFGSGGWDQCGHSNYGC